MAPPGNGIFVVRGEMSVLMTAMKRNNRWNSNIFQDDDQDTLFKSLVDLKNTLNKIEDLRLIEPGVFLSPFLDVIRSEETTGAITSIALTSMNKFLAYGLIDPTHSTLAATVENIADAVSHARFVGSDNVQDGVVLMKIIQVLRTLLMNPEGSALSNDALCEIMVSCCRMAIEPRLHELLRRTAEHALRDIVLLLFMRLPQFSEDRHPYHMKKLDVNEHHKHSRNKGGHKFSKSTESLRKSHSNPKISVTVKSETDVGGDCLTPAPETPLSSGLQVLKPPPLGTTPVTPSGNVIDLQGDITQTTPRTSMVSVSEQEEQETEVTPSVTTTSTAEMEERPLIHEDSVENDADIEDDGTEEVQTGKSEEYINTWGVRFTPQSSANNPIVPYGLPCIRELFRFLISLCNPLDKQNTDPMIHLGLNLLTVALEVGADSIGKFDSLLTLVKDELCRNLFSLLSCERLTIFAADLQLCFLLFESLRGHLKFQLEYYLGLLAEIVGSENPKVAYEARELALDNLLQFWRIPGFAAEIYVNYDCDLYCTNLFENLTKLLSKTTLSTYDNQRIYGTQVIAMDALLNVIESIERNCVALKSGGAMVIPNVGGVHGSRHSHSRANSSVEKALTDDNENTTSGGESFTVENITKFMNSGSRGESIERHGPTVSKEQLMDLKNKKQIITQGTELFNNRADKGVQFLMENGILSTPLDPAEVAHFLRENPGLDKKMIGEYISKKKNVEIRILESFVKSFDFSNMSIDRAMRLYLESFRLPGEAPLIFLVIEHFADHWHKCNNEPFANTDAAFKVAYSIIMLNMDQHNHNAKRLNIPMTAEDYQKNLRGLNGNGDFDAEVLNSIFNAIKNEEIVMPAEQTGIVKENYLWKVLLRRGACKDGCFNHVRDSLYDKEIFQIVWGSTLSALSYMFDKTAEPSLMEKAKAGFLNCATISAHYCLSEDLDAVVLTLCKFSTLLNVPLEVNEILAAVNFGNNYKAQEALKSVFTLVHDHGDCMREGWKNILEVILTIFRLKMIPKSLMEVEDFCELTGRVTLIHEKIQLPKTESGIFSSLYSYLSNDSQRVPTYDELEIIKKSKKCVKDCQIDQMIVESKFLQSESLSELVKSLLAFLRPPDSHKSLGVSIYQEDQIVFVLEFLVKILIQNRDRVLNLWAECRDTIYLLLMGGATCGYEYLLNRTVIAILKLAIYLMRNEELCPVILQSLNMLLMLKPQQIYRISRQISIGMYELLKTSAQNIHTEADWAIVFTILECVGAGAVPPDFGNANGGGGEDVVNGTKSDGAVSSEEDSGLPDRGYTSDSEILKSAAVTPTTGENWIIVNRENDKLLTRSTSPSLTNILPYPCKLLRHSPFALVKCWESLAFIVRNVAHITPYNFESCVKCIRTFVEASIDGGKKLRKVTNSTTKSQQNRKKATVKSSQSGSQKSSGGASSDSETDEFPEGYQTIAIQLLDLMHTLHTRTAQIFRWWAEEGGALPQCSALWEQGWRPILQGISRLATDQRRQVRTSAITCLQRSLLVHDLQTLSGPEWSSCFKQVLFPLLNELLTETNLDGALLEESRMRTATIMSKVFLHHLTPLIALSNFRELWMEILEYLEKFMRIGPDMLYEAVLESLKNMLLVMHSVRVFHNPDGMTHSPLWDLTWSRVGEFLPSLKEELFRDEMNDRPRVEHQVGAVMDSTPFGQPPVQMSQNISIISPPPMAQQPQQQIYSMSPPITQVNFQLQPQPMEMLPAALPTINQHQPMASSPSPPPSVAISALQQQLPKSSIILQQSVNLMNPPQGSPIFVPTPMIVPHMTSPMPEVTTNQHSPQHFIQNYPNLSPQHHASERTESHSNKISLVDVQNPPIPISHLMAGNQYPSLNRVPSNIAQSFAPIFVQPNQQQPVEGGDIYADYVNNPYNLTLQDQPSSPPIGSPKTVELTSQPNGDSTNGLTTQTHGVSNVFQSSNYFGSQSGEIPPGSEMLFGGSST